jgi:hypothetical protein
MMKARGLIRTISIDEEVFNQVAFVRSDTAGFVARNAA